MGDSQIRFDDGVAYEDFMGAWSLLAGDGFLAWLGPPQDARWVDVGCGNGAFTELVVARCTPRQVDGVDPSDGQLAYARRRLAKAPAHFVVGDAMALPYPDAAFDIAVMALVIFFVPDPAAGVAEMARVVRPGGSVSAYAWDIVGGGFPYGALEEEMIALGLAPLWPPNVDAARIDRLQSSWAGAGLVDVETHVITVERTFANFDAFWAIARTGPPIVPWIKRLSESDTARITNRLRERLPAAPDGRVTVRATANAVRGTVPHRR